MCLLLCVYLKQKQFVKEPTIFIYLANELTYSTLKRSCEYFSISQEAVKKDVVFGFRIILCIAVDPCRPLQNCHCIP